MEARYVPNFASVALYFIFLNMTSDLPETAACGHDTLIMIATTKARRFQAKAEKVI